MRDEQPLAAQRPHLVQAIEVGLQPVSSVREQRDAGRYDEQHVVAAEQDARGGLVERQVPGRVAGRLHHAEPVAPHLDGIPVARRHELQARGVEQARLHGVARIPRRIGRRHALGRERAARRIVGRGRARGAHRLEVHGAHVQLRAGQRQAVDQSRMVEVQVREEEAHPRAVDVELVQRGIEDGEALVRRRARVDDQHVVAVFHDVAVRVVRGDVLERHAHLEHVGIAMDLDERHATPARRTRLRARGRSRARRSRAGRPAPRPRRS